MLNSILMLIAGIGVFLFGIQTFSSYVEKLSGNKVRKELNKFSNNRFASIGSGFIFTSLLQSSTAGIVMIAGFTSAGLINIFQAFGLTLGSSMASAIPNFLISFTTFNITYFFAALAGVGALILVFSKSSVVKNIATAIISFSLIFVGMRFIGDGASFFISGSAFVGFFDLLTNPFFAILIGIGFTLITQSSLATIAVIMTLVGTSAIAGVIPVESAVYMVYGANIGSAITTLILISFSSNLDGKRVGVLHFFYVLLGVIAFSLLSMTPWITYMFSWVAEPTFKIAFVNLTFNIVTALLVIPFMKPLISLIRKVMPSRQIGKNPLIIDEIPNEAPSITLARANEKLVLFYDAIISLYKRTSNYILKEDDTQYKKLFNDLTEYNVLINKYNIYVIRIATNDAYESVNKEIEILLNIIKQVERINRNCIKIISALKTDDEKIKFTDKLIKFIENETENTIGMLEDLKRLIGNNKSLKNKDCSSCYENILKLSQDNSQIKLTSKTFVIEMGYNKSTTKRNTSYIELMSYLGLISNNILDVLFTIVGQVKGVSPQYEQLILDNIPKE
ncbi:MAG: Na/Pi symporter [Clostridia bacterium]|nr:Na/Pi symporter [Clostridia bacterium]